VSCRNPGVGVDGAGNATAIWDRFASSYEVQSASRDTETGTWNEPVKLASGGSSTPSPELAVATQGGAVAVWSEHSDQTGYLVHGAIMSPRRQWLPAQTISAQHSLVPQVAIDGRGGALSIWQRADGQNLPYRIEATSRRSVAGSWAAPIRISAEGSETFQQQDLAMDASGNGAAAWKRGSQRVEVAGYDNAGPVFDGLVIPKQGRRGEGVTFSVAPHDVWSALAGPPLWIFGDGSSASGNRVTHTYSTAGSFTVRLGESDALGNASVLARPVQIRSSFAR
jgi:hypothetical protein